MTTTPTVVVHPDATLLARSVAARLVTAIVDAQAARGAASVVLTGGGIGTAVLRELAGSAARDAIDWRALDVWWGDERWLAGGDEERNETGARSALLDTVPVDPARVHPMPATDGEFPDVDAAAAAYAELLAAAARPEDHAAVPSFDVLLLGIGPEGHVASLFPDAPAIYEEERTVVGVRNSPKPPAQRITLTLPAIRAAREVWVIAAGEEKADAVRASLEGAGPIAVPAAGARGRFATRYLLDRAAGSRLPAGLARPTA
jgi:6-phosphogluconolactonase